jgi:uncharacterized cupin superfamily protein
MFSASRRHRHVVHIDHVPTEEEGHLGFAHLRKQLWLAAGGKQVACTWYEVPPGKQAAPHQFHTTYEEAIFVLEGKGAARIGDDKIGISAGDYIACPPGPAAAHSIINTGDAPLRYLCVSTVSSTDVTVYPDSGKIAISARADPTLDDANQTAWVDTIVNDQTSIEFYQGETGPRGSEP